MALKPLDLQTLFGHMNEVGKNQSQLKESIAAQQNFEAKKLVEQELQKDKSVNQTEESQESGKISDQEKEESAEQNASSKERQKEETQKVQREEIKDPNLGQNIDLLG